MAESSEPNVESHIAKFIETYQTLCVSANERILSRHNLPLKAVYPFAASLTIVDISDAKFWHVRLSGTQTCECLGQDTTGGNAQCSFPKQELALRTMLAHSMFDGPWGVRTNTRVFYDNGGNAMLDTISLPLLGEEGQRLVAHFAKVLVDVEHEVQQRPRAEKTELASYAFVDLGYGLPEDESLRISA